MSQDFSTRFLLLHRRHAKSETCNVTGPIIGGARAVSLISAGTRNRVWSWLVKEALTGRTHYNLAISYAIPASVGCR